MPMPAGISWPFDDESWSRLPLSVRRTLFGQPLERLMQDIPEAARGTGFDHPRAHVGYSHVALDDEGMDAVADLLKETLERVEAIAAESKARLDGAEAPLQTELGVVHCERP